MRLDSGGSRSRSRTRSSQATISSAQARCGGSGGSGQGEWERRGGIGRRGEAPGRRRAWHSPTPRTVRPSIAPELMRAPAPPAMCAAVLYTVIALMAASKLHSIKMRCEKSSQSDRPPHASPSAFPQPLHRVALQRPSLCPLLSAPPRALSLRLLPSPCAPLRRSLRRGLGSVGLTQRDALPHVAPPTLRRASHALPQPRPPARRAASRSFVLLSSPSRGDMFPMFLSSWEPWANYPLTPAPAKTVPSGRKATVGCR